MSHNTHQIKDDQPLQQQFPKQPKMATSLHDLLESSNFSEALNLINSGISFFLKNFIYINNFNFLLLEIKSLGVKAQLIQAKVKRIVTCFSI